MRWRIAVILAALLSAPLVMAQTTLVIANVPFPFQVGKVARSAGEWTISPIHFGAFPVIQMRNNSNGQMMLTVGNAIYRAHNAPLDAKLVFNRYGDRYFLSEVWGAGYAGVYLIPCKEEKALRLAGLKMERTVTYARLR